MTKIQEYTDIIRPEKTPENEERRLYRGDREEHRHTGMEAFVASGAFKEENP